ncbi:MAG: hypothetical protein J5492_02360 [Oxalobacter sp.]|nr:hypothetical protein [Oxalobacter sp.]
MWIMLNDGFLSIIKKDCAPDELLVQARRPGDIERVFPQVVVQETLENDYRYQAAVKKSLVMEAISKRIEAIDYPDFTESVEGGDLLNAYMEVWGDMENIQVGGACNRHVKRNQLLGGGGY